MIAQNLLDRSGGQCELCSDAVASETYIVSPKTDEIPEHIIALCSKCSALADSLDSPEPLHFLAGSIYSEVPAVQALTYRLLHANRQQEWAAELLSSFEPPDSIQEWALFPFQEKDIHKDCYGKALENGDTVVLTESLNVKGTSFRAPAGTIVRKIRLVTGDTGQIEGKINDQTIVILTKFVRKSAP
jgi:protein PhnA